MHPTPKAGSKLPNGALVIDAQSVRDDDERIYIVFCIFDDKYVTWVYNRETGGTGMGHYNEHFSTAAVAYSDRVETY